MKAIGLISGTSIDGIDAVVVDISDDIQDNDAICIKVLGFATYPYPEGLRERILDISLPGCGSVENICHLNAYLGELFAKAAIQIAEEAGISLHKIDVIGSHGQTIHHLPRLRNENDVIVTSTLQIGEPSIIAERTGVTTVADFRPRDMAAGGEGAPFAPYAHYLLFGHPLKSRIITNIGGISNVTYIPAGAFPDHVVAFDSGPGNMVIDQLMTRMSHGKKVYDEDGQQAARGKCHPGLLAWMMNHPYLKRQPPKSTGREMFGQDFVNRLYGEGRKREVSEIDLLRTVTEFTAESIVKSCHEFLPLFKEQRKQTGEPLEAIFCGGGVRNRTLMKLLQQRMDPVPICSVEKFHISSDALEAITFALLARETIRGKPANLPGVTGAKHSVVLGKIVPGKRFRGLHFRN